LGLGGISLHADLLRMYFSAASTSFREGLVDGDKCVDGEVVIIKDFPVGMADVVGVIIYRSFSEISKHL
jgi:ribosomal protein S4E